MQFKYYKMFTFKYNYKFIYADYNKVVGVFITIIML